MKKTKNYEKHESGFFEYNTMPKSKPKQMNRSHRYDQYNSNGESADTLGSSTMVSSNSGSSDEMHKQNMLGFCDLSATNDNMQNFSTIQQKPNDSDESDANVDEENEDDVEFEEENGEAVIYEIDDDDEEDDDDDDAEDLGANTNASEASTSNNHRQQMPMDAELEEISKIQNTSQLYTV